MAVAAKKRTVFFVSDQTGITAETMGRSLLTQFEDIEFRMITMPFVSDDEAAREAIRRINLTAELEGERPLVCATFVDDRIRGVLQTAEAYFLDFFDAFIGPLEEELGVASTHTTGRAHGQADDAVYRARIDAINFSLAYDDGLQPKSYEDADVILVGVSRSGKTPTSLYLALHYGVFAANFPLTEEHFDRDGRGLPSPIRPYQRKLYGLTIEPQVLVQIREDRKPNSRYASPQQIRFEVREAEALYKRHAVPYTNTTRSSVEEVAARIVSRMRLPVRARRD
ncbi:MAG: pyruvate, water dikinase regulatory protein [Pseudomonadota bacterium]